MFFKLTKRRVNVPSSFLLYAKRAMRLPLVKFTFFMENIMQHF